MAIAASNLQRWLLIGLAAAGFPAGIAIVWLTWWNGWSWFGTLLMSFSLPISSLLYGRFFPRDVRPAVARHNARLIINMAVYFVALWGAVMLHQRGLTRGALGYAAAVVVALPIANCFLLMARWLREETDEFIRRVMVEAMVWSAGLTLSEATFWGFLETFGKVPNVWMWVVPLAFFAQFGITAPLVQRKYR